MQLNFIIGQQITYNLPIMLIRHLQESQSKVGQEIKRNQILLFQDSRRNSHLSFTNDRRNKIF